MFLGLVATKETNLRESHIKRLWDSYNFEWESVEAIKWGTGFAMHMGFRFYQERSCSEKS